VSQPSPSTLDFPDQRQIAAAREALAKADPVLAAVHAATPIFPWRAGQGGFAGLVRMIVGQQVSTAAAAAIWARLEQGLGEVAPEAAAGRGEEGLKALGLSRPKARYVVAMAEACRAGHMDFDRLPVLDDGEAVAALTALKGVGRWSAEVYLMFCEGRRDFFPAADIALQEALRLAEGGERRRTIEDLYARSADWAPHRSVAAHLLWRFYAGVRSGEIAFPPG